MTPLVDMEKDSLSERVRELRAGVMVSAGEFHQWFDLWAESLAETAGEPMVVRRARAFAHMLDHMDIELPRGALIVGRHPKMVMDEETRRLLRSVTKADYVPAVGGVTFNVKVAPELFETEERMAALEAALRTYFDAGGFQVQVNVLNRSMLEEAQEHPERHGNLIVRVGGFSAYFVELDRGLQEEIIARTAHQ